MSILQLLNYFSMHRNEATSIPQFRGNLMGDVEEEILRSLVDGDVNDDVIELTIGDVSDFIQGGPTAVSKLRQTVAKKVIARKPSQKVVLPTQNRGVMDPARFGISGARLESTMLPVFWPTNATLVQMAIKQPVPGSQIKAGIERMRLETPLQTQMFSKDGGGAVPTVLTIANTDLNPSGASMFVPIVIMTLSVSTINARTGAQIKIKIAGKNNLGMALDEVQWVIQRTDVNKPVAVALVPTIRTQDIVSPSFAVINATQSLSITMENVAATETLQVILPGIDSNELQSFHSVWKML